MNEHDHNMYAVEILEKRSHCLANKSEILMIFVQWNQKNVDILRMYHKQMCENPQSTFQEVSQDFFNEKKHL